MLYFKLTLTKQIRSNFFLSSVKSKAGVTKKNCVIKPEKKK